MTVTFWWELARYPVGPDRNFRGVPTSAAMVEVMQVAPDPNPMPRLRLFGRRAGRSE